MDRFHHPDIVARLGYFPRIQSLRLVLPSGSRELFKFVPTNQPSFHSIRADQYTGGLLGFEDPRDQHVLDAVFSLKHLHSLSLDLTAGDSLRSVPWENMSGLTMLNTEFDHRAAQGTFCFLPRLPSLLTLRADIDFFSLSCIPFLTNLTSLDLKLSRPVGGHLNHSQAQERDNEALFQVLRLKKLQQLDYWQLGSATPEVIASLSELTCLTSLGLHISGDGCSSISLWALQSLLQQNPFCLQHMYIELFMDCQVAVAKLADDVAAPDCSYSSEVCFPVFWSPRSVSVSPKDGVCAWNHDSKSDGYNPLDVHERQIYYDGYPN